MQSDIFRFGTIIKISLCGFFCVGPKLFPRIALSEDVLSQALGRISTLNFFSDFEDQLTQRMYGRVRLAHFARLARQMALGQRRPAPQLPSGSSVSTSSRTRCNRIAAGFTPP